MISKQQQFISRVTLSVLLGLWMDVANGMPSIQLIPKYPVIQGSVTLSVTGITGRIQSITWFKGQSTDNTYQILSYFPNDDKSPLTRGPLYDNRIEAFPNGSLLFSNLKKTDEGFYTVKIQTDKPNDIFVNLQIYEMVGKPTITASNLYPPENDTVILTCNATNAETIIWSRIPAGTTLSPDNRTVTISKINRLDSGDYSCEAINLVSQKKSDSITITVAYGPENVRIIIHPGSSPLITLECLAESFPNATYQWTVNGTDINVQQNQLKIDTKKAGNVGIYTCVVNNSLTQLSAMDSIDVNATIADSDDNNGNESSASLGLIVGIVLAVILLVVLAAALVYLFVIHKQRKKFSNDKNSTIKTQRNGQTNPSVEAAASQHNEQPELQYADIVFSTNRPKKTPPLPETLYANRADLAHPLETVYSELRLN